MRRRTIRAWPVRKTMCPSCPFREGGDKELAGRVLGRTLFKASQICHHPVLHGEKEHDLCRGARNEQLKLLHRMGLIDAPTDEAFTRKSDVHEAAPGSRVALRPDEPEHAHAAGVQGYPKELGAI